MLHHANRQPALLPFSSRILAIFLLCGAMHAQAQTAPSETVVEILRKSDSLMRGETQTGLYSLVIVRPDWQRTIEFEFWSVGTDQTFIRIKEPIKERGVSFLKIKREMWQYIPRINRVIKIPPSMMLQSWMGSGFTNDDLVRESSIIDDYTHKLLGEEGTPEGMAYHIELTPKPEAPVAWARLLYWVRKADYVPLRAEFFNERGSRVRTIAHSDIRSEGGRTLPTRLELVEDRWPDRKTILILNDLTFDQAINPSVFTQSNLRRTR